jgi:hypothetical protein
VLVEVEVEEEEVEEQHLLTEDQEPEETQAT